MAFFQCLKLTHRRDQHSFTLLPPETEASGHTPSWKLHLLLSLKTNFPFSHRMQLLLYFRFTIWLEQSSDFTRHINPRKYLCRAYSLSCLGQALKSEQQWLYPTFHLGSQAATSNVLCKLWLWAEEPSPNVGPGSHVPAPVQGEHTGTIPETV